MKIDTKITLWTIAVIVAISLVSGAVSLRFHFLQEEEGFKDMGATIGPIVEESIEHSMVTRDDELMRQTLDRISGIAPIQAIWLLDSKGEVRSSSLRQSVGKQLPGSRLQCDACHRNGTQGRYLNGESRYRWMQPLRNKPACYRCHPASQRHNGFFVIDFSTERARAILWREVRNEMLSFVPSLAIVGFVMLFLIRHLVIQRLNIVSDVFKRFATGDTGVRIPHVGRDELALLGDGFNSMAETLSGSQQELKQYADELLSLAVSSNVVTAIPRMENVYEAVCNIAVRELGVRMAWIGAVRDGDLVVTPLAQSGLDSGYLQKITITADDSPTGQGPTGTAIRTKTPQVMNDAERDPRFAAWRDEAVLREFRSSMALPLLDDEGGVMAILNLYSEEPGFFTRKRVRIFVVFGNQVAAAIENRGLIEHLEQRNAEIAEQMRLVSRSQKEWQLTFDSITDLISIHDREYRVIKANRAFLTFFGLSREEIESRKCFEIFHCTQEPIPACPHALSMRENRVVTQEVQEPRLDKTFLVSVFPYFGSDGAYFGSVHIARDITEIKEKEMRLIMSERLASLGQMASGIAHEINNPLASIAGCAEGLQLKLRRNKFDAALFEEYLGIIQEETRRCKNITTGMLSFVRKTAYEKKDLQINDVLDKTVEVIGFQGRLANVEIVRRYDPDLPRYWGSDGELRQVFLALITNSLDAMQDAGRLTLGTGREGDAIVVTIADTGPGIPPEHRSRIFDPFFTTKSDSGGTGLGLSIAHKIIANHNGVLEVDSAEDGGALFRITLPSAPSPERGRESA